MTIRLLNQDILDLAERFATQAHEGQKRKYGDEPYINHPRRVAMLVAGHRLATTDMVAAAWGHDCLEDTDTSLFEILDLFGGQVMMYVDALSKKKGQSKVQYYESLGSACIEVKIIKLCDRLDNVSDLGIADTDFRQYYIRDTKRLLTYIEDADSELSNLIRTAISRPY